MNMILFLKNGQDCRKRNEQKSISIEYQSLSIGPATEWNKFSSQRQKKVSKK